VGRYKKGKTNLDYTEARDSEWQWHQLGHMQVCISLQTDNHASTSPLSFLQAGCPSCRPTNSVKALKVLGQSVLTAHISLAICGLHTRPWTDVDLLRVKLSSVGAYRLAAREGIKKVKVAHTQLPNIGFLIPVLGSQPAGGLSHKPGGRLPLLSARPAVTHTTLKSFATSLAAW